ncbi:MAG: carboxypeptidase M32 [Spirochaetales bacterium]|nr:carboxypeptidase M32 [Spirochaetales bacterium]
MKWRDDLRQLDKEIVLLAHSMAILGWDQETYMPRKAIGERAEQLALLQGICHDKIVDPRWQDAFESMGIEDVNRFPVEGLSDDQALLREAFRRYQKEAALSKDLVMAISRQTSLSQAKWAEAKKARNYSIFEPELKKLFALVKEKAETIGYQENIYDALLDDYEPYMTLKELEKVFDDFKGPLKDLFFKICDQKSDIPHDFLHLPFSVEKQKKLNKEVLNQLKFPFERARLDESEHPFTTTLGMDDVRITTHFHEEYFPAAFFGTVHEAGHALYELGIDSRWAESVIADGVSLGVHESQSRLWENIVFRGKSYWQGYYPELSKIYPENFKDVRVDQFYKAINRVEPSLIRIEADELSYNLHIIIRFELEKRLFAGDIDTKDLPEAWNKAYKDSLGIMPSHNSEGVLQDIHWSMGAFGYFPTYSLGNLYSAQIYHKMKQDISDLEQDIANRKFDKMVQWLGQNIHQYGKFYRAKDLMKKATGEDLNPKYFMNYLNQKFGEIYGL